MARGFMHVMYERNTPGRFFFENRRQLRQAESVASAL